MDIKGIPVRFIGPGSQPGSENEAGEQLQFIDMPGEMWTYQPPSMPEPDEVGELNGAYDCMRWLQQALADYATNQQPQIADLSALDEADRQLVNQILGEGEVSITYNGKSRARTQEAVLAGVWRTVYLGADDEILCDLLEVADAPHTVRSRDGRDRAVGVPEGGAPAEVMNALPILVELESRWKQFDETQAGHVINLTLLPLSTADVEFMDAELGRGPIDILSRAYGNCQVISTKTPNIWWVRYYNSMGTLILNTLEVADVPPVVCAAVEDLADSAVRLADILTPYWSEVA